MSDSENGRRLHAVDDGLQRRREAIGDLGDALRLLVENATATEAPCEQLQRAAELIRRAAAGLGERARGRWDSPAADDMLAGVRLYNPVTGAGSALAPPLEIHRAGALSVGVCTLGLAFEGPPGYAHGGVSAMLLDQMLGHAVGHSGNPGMTVRLDTGYRKPVPLLTPLRLTAEVAGIDGRRVTATGTITTEAEPGEILVEATGVFVALRADQARELFGRVIGRDRESRAG